MSQMNPTREDFAALLDESFEQSNLYEGSVVKGKVVDDEDNRKALHGRLLDSLKNARDPWQTSREGEAKKQFIPIAVDA